MSRRSIIESVPPSHVHVLVEDAEGRMQDLRFGGTFRIGRGTTCEVRVASGHVSREHAEVSYEDDQWWVRDLGSTNGLFLNGAKVERAALPAEAELQPGRNAPTLHLRIEMGDVSRMTPAPPREPAKGISSATVRHTMRNPEGAPVSYGDGGATPRREEVDPSMSQVIRRYFDEDSGQPAGEYTQMIRSAYKTVKKKNQRRYRGIIIGVLALFVLALGFGVIQHLKNQKMQEQAALLFDDLKKQDLEIAQFRQAIEETSNESLEELLAAAEERRELMKERYDGLIEQFGLYRKLDEEEALIYRMARIFNESQFTIPAGFVHEVKRVIEEYWLSSAGRGRFERSIQQAEENGYTPHIVAKLKEYGLPPEFFYLALQESNLNPNAVGPDTRWGRAKGMWQFIPSTAQRYGLDVGERTETAMMDPQDERHDVSRATDAAARYLLYIYSTPAQASGLLVMASYNWGEHRVIKKLQDLENSEDAIDVVFAGIAENPDERNYWTFLEEYADRMPEETKDYVLKIFAASVIGQNPRHFGFDFDNPLQPYMEEPVLSGETPDTGSSDL